MGNFESGRRKRSYPTEGEGEKKAWHVENAKVVAQVLLEQLLLRI